MLKASKSKFKVVEGNRRRSNRGTSVDSPILMINSEIGEFRCAITSSEFCRFTISVGEPLHIDQNKIYDLKALQGDEVVVSGNWKVIGLRPQEEGMLVAFELSEMPKLKEFINKCSPEIFLKKSRYRLLDFQIEDDLQVESMLLTEIKDFPMAIAAKINTKAGPINGKFDFSSERQVLDVLEFQVEPNCELGNIGSVLEVEFEFLGTRYLFHSKLRGYDEEFNICELDPPLSLLAITARRYDRYRCDLPVTLKATDLEYRTNLKDVSVSGASTHKGDQLKLDLNQKLQVLETNGEKLCDAEVVSLSHDTISLRFLNTEQSSSNIRKILSIALPKDLTLRSFDNYERFLSLYREVGYSNSENYDAWEQSTLSTWKYQDSKTPGSCTGGLEDNNVISSIGTLPWGKHTVYSHSLCMIKTAHAVGTLLKQTLHSLAMSELYSHISYYAGSYAKNSRFTPRLHVAFEFNSRPDRQSILHTQQLFPVNAVSFVSNKIEVSPLAEDDLKYLNPKIRPIFELIRFPHEIISEAVNISGYRINLAGNKGARALVLKSESLLHFTAADMLAFTWIFSCTENESLVQLVSGLRSNSLFSDRPFEVINFNGDEKLPQFDTNDTEKPAFFSFTHKDDFGPVLASVYRAFYSLLKKYGADASAEIRRLI